MSKSLLRPLESLVIKENQLDSKKYSIHPVDFKNIDLVKNTLKKLGLVDAMDNYEFCFLFECVLVYMPVVQSDSVLKLLANFPNSEVHSYEQVNLNDRFGQVMHENLIARGCGLDGLDACLSEETQKQRFMRNGWSRTECTDMYTIYNNLSDRSNIEKLEFLDDVEIFRQLLQHYCLTSAFNFS